MHFFSKWYQRAGGSEVLHLASYAVILVGAVLIGAFAVGALCAQRFATFCNVLQRSATLLQRARFCNVRKSFRDSSVEILDTIELSAGHTGHIRFAHGIPRACAVRSPNALLFYTRKGSVPVF